VFLYLYIPTVSLTLFKDDEELREQLRKIVATYIQRFEHLFMLISQRSPGDPLLKRISLLSASATQVISAVREQPILSPQSIFNAQMMGSGSHRM
jgi:hypothetical protein